MTEERFDLVFDGRLGSGFSQAQVRQNMAELFSLGDAQLEALFSGRVVVLKRGLDKGQAIRFRNRLAQAGALGLIRPQQAAERPDVAPESTPAAAAVQAVAAAPRPAPAPAKPAVQQPVAAAAKPAPAPVARVAPVAAKPVAAPAAAKPVTSPAAAKPAVATAPTPTPSPAVPANGGEQIACPRCGHEQPRSETCGACRMDLRLHLQRLEKRARLVAAARRS